MIKYGFFNSKLLTNGDYDRKYNADDVNNFFKGAMSRDGIYQFVGNQCRVMASSGMNVIVRDGRGQINYHWFENTANEIININEAHATLDRWTAIIARYDSANRNIYLMAVDGAAAESPAKPTIQRTDTLRDIVLAYVYVAAGVTEITNSDITDTVEDIEVCGFISSLLDGTDSILKVNKLPIPSLSCQGKIYYLREKSKTNGKTYEKGYYYCEPSNTYYDFDDFDFTTDIASNRPTASEDYLEILFYASDTDTWYRCIESSEDVYEWQEVTVNEVEELPEATEDIYNNFYIVGNSLYIVSMKSTNYKWYMFGTGSGGGRGDYAVIRIEYPEGTEVQVTFDGDTVDATDTSGTWLYGCDKAGTYTVGIKNTSITKEVEITAQGQVESIYISPQVINYRLIYYLGNEFASPTEEERQYAIPTGGWNESNASIQTSSSNTQPGAAGYKTAVNVNTNGFSKMFMTGNFRDYGVYNWNGFGIGSEYKSNVGSKRDSFLNSAFLEVIYQNSSNHSQTFNLSQYNNIELNSTIQIGTLAYRNGGEATSGTWSRTFTNTKNSNNLYMKCNFSQSGNTYYTEASVYALGFVNEDDISGLSDYGSTISEICANAVSLFDDISALEWMVLNCTGDFMISALVNSNFVNAMNASSNKTIVTANEHWARFIALLSV